VLGLWDAQGAGGFTSGRGGFSRAMMAAMFARDPVRVERMTQGAEDGCGPRQRVELEGSVGWGLGAGRSPGGCFVAAWPMRFRRLTATNCDRL